MAGTPGQSITGTNLDIEGNAYISGTLTVGTGSAGVVQAVTSTDGSLTITNGGGPTVNAAIANNVVFHYAGNPNTHVTALHVGDVCIDTTDGVGSQGVVFTATAADNSHWVQIQPNISAGAGIAVTPGSAAAATSIATTGMASALSFFGNGADGAGVADGAGAVAGMSRVGSVYTMERDCYFTNLTLSAGVTIYTAGFQLFANGTLTNPATAVIHADGPAGSNAVADAAGAKATLPAITVANASIPVGPDPTDGAAGGTGAGTDGTTTTTTNLFGVSTTAAGNGGAGGAGSGGAGGNTVTGPAFSFPYPPNTFPPQVHNYEGDIHAGVPGASGSSGGGDGANKGGGGGGGPYGGSWLICFAKTIVNGGAIRAAGGAGGNGGDAAAGNCGGGGGAGGGSGGVVWLAYNSLTDTGTITAPGGAPGNGGAKQGTGVVGSVGLVGGAGIVVKLNLATGVFS